jgi:replicative DNA helicase
MGNGADATICRHFRGGQLMSQLADSLQSQFDRLPPSSVEAEMCLLASMMLDRRLIADVMLIVDREDFYQSDHQIIFDVVVKLHQGDHPIDGVIVREELAKRQLLEEVGGLPYLAQILNCVPSSLHFAHYASIVREKAILRRLIAASNSILRAAYAPMQSADDVLKRAEQHIGEILKRRVEPTHYERIDAVAETVLDDFDSRPSDMVPSGYTDLDKFITGFGDGEFWVLGARPSMGKSTLARGLALRIARLGSAAAIISLEEHKKKMARNYLASESGIDNHKLRSRNLAKEEHDEIINGYRRLVDVPLFVSNSARKIGDIESLASVLKAKEGIKLLIVDYLQKISGTYAQDRYGAVTEISLRISDLAKRLNLAILCPAQLSRAVTNRDNKRPTISDLRESGQIDQDADGIIFLHREDYYRQQEGNPARDGIAELIIAKNRDGPRGVTVKLRSDLRHQRFEDLIDEPQPSQAEEEPT